jgi:hypothetical protein
VPVLLVIVSETELHKVFKPPTKFTVPVQSGTPEQAVDASVIEILKTGAAVVVLVVVVGVAVVVVLVVVEVDVLVVVDVVDVVVVVIPLTLTSI